MAIQLYPNRRTPRLKRLLILHCQDFYNAETRKVYRKKNHS